MPSPAAPRLPESAVTILVFSAVAAIAAAMPVQNDTWWHLRSGMDTLHGHWPFTDRYSWTVAGSFFWNHSWLAQIVMYTAYAAGGLPLLTAVCAVAVVSTWWLVWRQCRGDPIERVVLLAIALPVATFTWSVRPQVAIVLLPVVVSCAVSTQPLRAALLMALWANLHAGFVIGVVALWAGVAAALIFDRPATWRRAITALAGTTATLATPLGLTNWREVAASVGRSRANEIAEWQPPGFDAQYGFFWALALLFVVLLPIRWRRLATTPYGQVSACAAAVALAGATQAMRNVPTFLLLALPPLATMLAIAPSHARAPEVSMGRAWRAAIALSPVVAAIVAVGLWVSAPPFMGWQPLSPKARSALAACTSPIFNTYVLGGPVIWFVPTQPVFVDSRQDPYPVTLVQQAANVEETGNFEELFERFGIACAAVPAVSPAAQRLKAAGWIVRSSDEGVVVLEKPPDIQ